MAKGQICRAQANSFLSTIFQNSYLGLSTTAPDENGGNVSEPPKSAGYERHQLTALEMEVPANGQIHNKLAIFMGESLDSWGIITHLIVSKSKEGGTVIFHAPLNAPVAVPEGHVPVFRKGALIVGIDKDVLDTPEFK